MDVEVENRGLIDAKNNGSVKHLNGFKPPLNQPEKDKYFLLEPHLLKLLLHSEDIGKPILNVVLVLHLFV